MAKQSHKKSTNQPTPGDPSNRELVAMHAEYSGPLPHPEILQAYEQVHPGIAERIVQRFEKESDHRQAIELKVVDAQINRDNADVSEVKRGQLFAFVLGAMGLLVGGAVALYGPTDAHAYAGAGIGGVTLVGLVTAFIVGRRNTQPSNSKSTG